ncbi:uncharacterized protein LOC109858834 [Pseudomyrmex gracilis]|uniref:uncharacterized protein LOC109858834 n=1 Tax=Pseudomyrmex gracilis TaxID=219809 RepID=UPI000995D80C|nr:uncharacterized protein LOC109858834 [Pseudomyrmex gracilis]
MLLQRRRLFRWRMSRLVPLMFLAMICGSELASVNVPQSSSTSSSDKQKLPVIGFKDVKWEAWLLLDTGIDTHEVDADSATQVRRITPKSVFVAPKIELSNCSDGYYADNMGRCVKNVNVNEDAHRNFLLERLNAQYALKPVNRNKNQSNGPLQLHIPLTSNLENQSHHQLTKTEKQGMMATFLVKDPILLPIRDAIRPDDEKKIIRQTEKEPASTTAKSDTTLNEEAIFFRKHFGASDASDDNKTDRKPVVMIPVVELVKESNDTNLSKTADYKIPLDVKTMLNILKEVDVSNVTEKDVSAEKRQTSTQVQPTTLVLLLSSTGLPDSNDPSQNNDTTDQTVRSNLTSTTVAKETTGNVVSSSTTVPTDTHNSTVPSGAHSSTTVLPKDYTITEVAPIAANEHRRDDNETHTLEKKNEFKVLENSKLNESQEIGIIYDEDEEDVDYTYVTNEPDEDESIEIENEEILKHGEAGITIPTRNIERAAHQNQTLASRNKTIDARDRIVIQFNDTASTVDDEADSNVSSDVSIDGDRILETTLLDVNTEGLQITTQLPESIEKIAKNDSKELFDRLSSESEVAFANEELEAAPTSSESLLYDRTEENPATRRIGGDEKSSNAEKKLVRENPRNIESDVASFDFVRKSTMNFDSTEEDRVFFSDNMKQPRQDGYVRFPSNEANSIHSSPTYKQQYPVDDHSFYGSTSTKSSVPVHQKPVYYLTRSSWKPDRPQRDHVPSATTNKRRRPELSFWNKMLPPIRDSAIYPVDQVPNDQVADDQVQQHRLLRTSPSSRRRSSYSEISSSGSTMLAQK